MAGPAHRSVSSIRPSISGGRPSSGIHASPHTPLRTISSSYSSPSTLRAEEECIVIELGCRSLRAGFAGDAYPKAVIAFDPSQNRRAGDFGNWQSGTGSRQSKRTTDTNWGEEHVLWRPDLKDVDLGLVGDKIERAMREACTKYLLVDSRPRKMTLVLPTGLPQPLLSVVLDTLFNYFVPPTISLLSAPVLTTVAAGLRSAIVVDIGWSETVVNVVYEYREVSCRRTVRACKLLCQGMLKLLETAVHSRPDSMEQNHPFLSFEECEEVMNRIAWCRPAKSSTSGQDEAESLAPVKEEEEIEDSLRTIDISSTSPQFVSIPLSSGDSSTTLRIPFSRLSDPAESALFADGRSLVELDDEEMPIHLLLYQALLQIPVDVRSVCMSRIVFTGGGSNIPGLKARVLQELSDLVHSRNWDPVYGRAVESKPRHRRSRASRSQLNATGPVEVGVDGQGADQPVKSASFQEQGPDPIEEKIKREARKLTRPSIQATLRVVESMGPWAGGSLLSQLKIPAVSVIEREQWILSGASGASRTAEVSHVTQRHSMGVGGLKSNTGDRTSWTLGPWA